MSDEDLSLPEEPVELKAKPYTLHLRVSREWAESLKAGEEWMNARIQKVLKEELFKDLPKEPDDDCPPKAG